jgi:hypothetical protein
MNTATAPQQQEAATLLADGLFLLAHDELNGKPLLSDAIVSLGLSGALLGELALVEKVSVRGDLLVVTDPEPPADPLSGAVHQRLMRSVAPRPVRDWLLYFADDAISHVSGRLMHAGRLTAQPSRLPGRPARCVPTDGNGAQKIALALCTKVMRRLPLDAPSALLAGLVGATGLEHPGLFEVRDSPQAARYLQESLQVLSPPTLREFVRATRAVVETTVVTHRA